jgi:hypothetical protein
MEKVPWFHRVDRNVSSVCVTKFSLRVKLSYGGSGVGDAVGKFIIYDLVTSIFRYVLEKRFTHGGSVYC